MIFSMYLTTNSAREGDSAAFEASQKGLFVVYSWSICRNMLSKKTVGLFLESVKCGLCVWSFFFFALCASPANV